jgi:Mitochondrial genome maintenance MGM101
VVPPIVTSHIARASSSGPTEKTIASENNDASDLSLLLNEESLPAQTPTDWSKSYHGLSTEPFGRDVADVLLAPIDPRDIEIKPGT